MQPEARKTLAIFLAEHTARHRGVVIPPDDRGRQVIDRAILAEMSKVPPGAGAA